ncbi:uncharacterized protein LOC120012576 [Tripterygium wilfordii]|uniref:uncharacterized protein LOC120012576 n=1 Tax=Tripterygium wilfordii TaxID=458696 RepID=UPI0018F7E55E|nr:uncharacterized protein LOC120012576 [Tripterygium wilfordii]
MSKKGKESLIEGDAQFKWDIQTTKIFLDMLYEWRKKNAGQMKWDKIADEFKVVSGKNCTMQKLKTKHDNMKQNWQLFNRLMTVETGLGFNFETGKVEATEDWCAARIQENINFKKFKNGGFQLRGEQDKLWGGSSANGENCVSPHIVLDNDFIQSFGADCYTPSPVDSSYDRFVDEFSTGSSPVKASTSTPGSTNTGGSRKRKRMTQDTIDPKFDKLCQQLQMVSEKQFSYLSTKQEYYDVKKEVAKKVENVHPIPVVQPVQPLMPVDPSYDASIKALVDMNITAENPALFYFAVQLFNTNSQRQLFLALPESARLGYIELLFKQHDGKAPIG